MPGLTLRPAPRTTEPAPIPGVSPVPDPPDRVVEDETKIERHRIPPSVEVPVLTFQPAEPLPPPKDAEAPVANESQEKKQSVGAIVATGLFVTALFMLFGKK